MLVIGITDVGDSSVGWKNRKPTIEGFYWHLIARELLRAQGVTPVDRRGVFLSSQKCILEPAHNQFRCSVEAETMLLARCAVTHLIGVMSRSRGVGSSNTQIEEIK